MTTRSLHTDATVGLGGPMVREPQPGDVVGGRYHIEAELGRGGFGVVFRGRHHEVEREVAVKVLLASYAGADPTAVARFRREAQIASSLHYPNTVQLFDYGETDEGVFYIVMEYLKGKPLSEVLARAGRLSPTRAVHIIRQVLHSLMEAHARGIVHRDIKPDNVMITPLAFDQDFVKVMDFGIAKMVSSEGSSLTQAGLTLGTPRYMPVEQLRGLALTPATDLYAVGVVLYELLTGRRAIEAGSLVEVASQVLDGVDIRVPPDAGVPPVLAAVVQKACSGAASDRYQRARDFLEALDAWQPDVLQLPGADPVSAADTIPDGSKTEIIGAALYSDAATQLMGAGRPALAGTAAPEATSVVRAPARDSSSGPPPATPRQVLNLLRLAVGLSGGALTLLVIRTVLDLWR